MPVTERKSTSSEMRDFERPADDRRPAELSPGQDLLDYAKDYARKNPGIAAAWCFGIGFIVGWRLKPW